MGQHRSGTAAQPPAAGTFLNRRDGPQSALSAGSAQQNAGVTSYLYHFIRKGSKVVV